MNALETVCNISLDESSGKQVLLPVYVGGLGFSSSIHLATSALASKSGTEDLLVYLGRPPDICYSAVLTVWMVYSGLNGVPVDDITKEKTCSKCVSKYQRDLRVSAADTYNKKTLTGI